MEEAVNFGKAIEALKKGKRVARTGWNGKGMWLKLVPGYGYELLVNTEPPVPKHSVVLSVGGRPVRMCDSVSFPEEPKLLPWIGMKTADDCFVPWLASQTDVLAEDWVIL